MNPTSSLSPAQTRALLETIIDAETLDRLTRSGSSTQRYTEPMCFKFTHRATGLSGSVVIKRVVSPATPPSAPAGTLDVNLTRSLTDLLMKYSASILISFSVWGTLLFGLSVAGLEYQKYAVLLNLLLIASVGINSYLLTTRLHSFDSGTTGQPQSSI